jgi:hypothetical protein
MLPFSDALEHANGDFILNATQLNPEVPNLGQFCGTIQDF